MVDVLPIPTVLREFIRANTLVTFSPGRINLIGEFTDYNNGFVLPAAIDKGAYFTLTPRDDEKICLYAPDFNEKYFTTIENIVSSKEISWPNYLLGVVEQFKNAGIELNGFDGAISGDIPIGAGLSSSAAVECATAMALNEFSETKFEKLDLVIMAQKAENEFVGVRCGIMDQFASMFGLRNHAIKLDCRSLEYEYIPLDMDGLRIVLLDTNVKHSHGTSQYNVRRKQCEKGAAMIHEHDENVHSLRDVLPGMLEEYILSEDETIYNRCKFILDENERVQSAAEDLKAGDLISFGKRMFASHTGLQNQFEASCTELDFLVDFVKDNSGVIGARMMGGGFGGCTINVVKEDAVNDLIETASVAYRKSMHKELTPYISKIEGGTTIVKRPQVN
jgi:galactokinase